MIEDRHVVVARAWGLARPARCQWEHELQEQVSPNSDAAEAMIQNHDLDTSGTLSHKGSLVQAPMVDSSEAARTR